MRNSLYCAYISLCHLSSSHSQTKKKLLHLSSLHKPYSLLDVNSERHEESNALSVVTSVSPVKKGRVRDTPTSQGGTKGSSNNNVLERSESFISMEQDNNNDEQEAQSPTNTEIKKPVKKEKFKDVMKVVLYLWQIIFIDVNLH